MKYTIIMTVQEWIIRLDTNYTVNLARQSQIIAVELGC